MEDGRHLDPDQIGKGIENFIGQAHELVFDGSGGLPDLDLRELIDGEILLSRPSGPSLISHGGDLLLDQVFGDRLDKLIHPLDLD
jgi:hypothetical protein